MEEVLTKVSASTDMDSPWRNSGRHFLHRLCEPHVHEPSQAVFRHTRQHAPASARRLQLESSQSTNVAHLSGFSLKYPRKPIVLAEKVLSLFPAI